LATQESSKISLINATINKEIVQAMDRINLKQLKIETITPTSKGMT
jgi:hypothetical protein